MTFARFWDTEKDAKLRRMAAGGATMRAVAEALGCVSWKSVQSRAVRLGVSFARGPVIRGDGWTEADDAVLRRMATEERASAREVADAVGKTRNAVLGRANRLGIALHGVRTYRVASSAFDPPTRAKKTKLKSVPRTSEKERVQLIKDMATTEGVPLEDFDSAHQCGYVVTDDVPFLFCGKDRKRGAYCEEHWKITHQAGQLARL